MSRPNIVVFNRTPSEMLEYVAELEAEIKAMELKLRAALRECDHCGALMPPALLEKGDE